MAASDSEDQRWRRRRVARQGLCAACSLTINMVSALSNRNAFYQILHQLKNLFI